MRRRHAAIPTITIAVVAAVHTPILRVRRAVPLVRPVSQAVAAVRAAIQAAVLLVPAVVAAAPEEDKYKYVLNK